MRKTLNSKQSSNLPKFIGTKFTTFGRKRDGKMKGIATSKKCSKKIGQHFLLAIYS